MTIIANKSGNKRNLLKVGSFNIRGINSDLKKCNLATDMERYKLDVLAIQETHIKGNQDIGVETLTSEQGKKFTFYYGKDLDNTRSRWEVLDSW